MMSLASQTLTSSRESGSSGTVAVLLATDFATVLAKLPCRAQTMVGVADEVQNCNSSSAYEGEAKVDCQWSGWNSWSPCSVTCGEGQYNRSRFEKGHWTRTCPITGKQVPRDGEDAKTSFFVYFGRDHRTSDYIGKGVIDTGC